MSLSPFNAVVRGIGLSSYLVVFQRTIIDVTESKHHSTSLESFLCLICQDSPSHRECCSPLLGSRIRPHSLSFALQDFAFAFQCFMLEYWDHEDTGRWPRNQSTSPDVSDDPAMMQDLLSELSKLEPGQAMSPWVGHILVIILTGLVSD